jgi:TonB-linked SusC/RagA family outer membrane protein
MHTLLKPKYLFLLGNILFLLATIRAQEPGTEKNVTGKMIDASSGKPIPGIKVGIPGFSSVITNDSGYFSLKVPVYTATLSVSGMGYHDKDVALKGQTTVNILLYDESFSSVYDNAVFAFGSKPLNRTIHAVSSEKIDDDAWKTPTDDVLKNTHGKLAGLNVISRSGSLGMGSEMFLRGYSSLNASNKPLVVVDGIIYDMNEYGNSVIENYFCDPLSNFDTRDIKNVTLAKDASSQYGSKAGNGVLYITTTKAEETATKINLNYSHGLNFSPKQYPVMGADDYRTYLSEMLDTKGLSSSQIKALPFFNEDRTSSDYYTYHNNTNWQDQVFKNSTNNNVYMQVTGGDETAVYGLSIGYLDQQGTVKNTDYSRFNIRFNSDIDFSSKFRFSPNLALTYGEHQLSPQGTDDKRNPIFLSLIKAPFLTTNTLTTEGKASPNLADADTFNIGNPAAVVGSNFKATNINYRFFGNFKFSYQFNPALALNSVFGLTTDKIREKLFIPLNGFVPDTLDNAIGYRTVKMYEQRLMGLNNDTRLTYHKIFHQKHDLSLNAGFRYNYNELEGDLDKAYNAATDELNNLDDANSSSRVSTGSNDKWNWMNGYAGIDYAFNSKYFFSANVGIDGSSRFGKDISGALKINGNCYGVFPSVGAAWLLSSENFMAGLPFVEMLKLRASYGVTGNDDIGNYNTRQLYTSKSLYRLAGLVINNLANTSLQWETNTKLNVGADLSLFHERLSMSLDVYRNTIDHMITYETPPSYAGTDQVITNNGGMKSHGAEYAVNGRILNGQLKWDVGFSVAYSKNKITRLPGDSLFTSRAGATVLSVKGGPAAGFYGYVTNGVYSSDAEAEASGLKNTLSNGEQVPFRGGDVRFVDLNGDHVINKNDRKSIGDPAPEFYGSFNTAFNYKRITLNAYFTYSAGNDIYNYTRYRLESMSGYENQTLAVRNRWRVDGQKTDMPRAEWGDPRGNSRFSDRWIEDGSYIKLKSVDISYNIPVNSTYFKSLVVYASAYNLHTWSKYLGFDPEFSSSSSPLLQGMDITMTPTYTTVMFGFKLGL